MHPSIMMKAPWTLGSGFVELGMFLEFNCNYPSILSPNTILCEGQRNRTGNRLSPKSDFDFSKFRRFTSKFRTSEIRKFLNRMARGGRGGFNNH